ncbi:LptA/OstA family protein [Candidatus Coxiella mudrowiae]|uniref:LptA/OstA family protein n=1 Tax=Candidatus Coxiella mudrowiae TaxID=2054173 RepID=UPI001FD257F9|nr:LptA/OstA family protein [Candidatus Coxiella mudrowiae]
MVPPPLYTTLPNMDKARLYAEANTIIYYPPKAQVVLIKNARVTQNQDILTEPHIWYDIKKQTVISINLGEKNTTTMVVEPQ